MNNAKVEQYFYLIDRFTPEEFDCALDGLVAATEKLEGVTNEEAFIFTAMKNRVRNQHVKEKSQTQRINNMNVSTEQEKEFVSSIPAGKVRKPSKRKGTFEQFYSAWLGENNLTDCMRNRREAEEAWDALKSNKAKPQEISLEDKIYDNSEMRVAHILPSSDPSPEDALLEREQIKQLASVAGIKSLALRSWIQQFLPLRPDVSKNELIAGYRLGILRLIRDWRNWRTKIGEDLPRLCALAEISQEKLLSIHPSEAKRNISKLEGVCV